MGFAVEAATPFQYEKLEKASWHEVLPILMCTLCYTPLLGNSANISLFLSAQESKPRPCSTVPFRQDNDFVYLDPLAEIHARCTQPAARVALVGLEGVV